MDKHAARSIATVRVAKMSDAEKDWASSAIIDAVIATEQFRKAKSIFVFSGAANEPDTHELIGLALALEKTVAVPKIDGEIMHAVAITPYSEFYTNSWGILEPSKGRFVDEFDLIIVPMVAFDENLNRAGHGKAYYDKFLSTHEAFKMGIAYDCQKMDAIEHDDTDIAMDMIISEKEILPTVGKSEHNEMFGEN